MPPTVAGNSAAGTGVADQPSLARSDGVDLIGDYEGSGFREPPSLVRRVDGQILQFPPLLYEVLQSMDGRHDLDQIVLSGQ